MNHNPNEEGAHRVRSESAVADITVAGGGMAGVCAAIAAARQGMRVNLVQNRPMLGGNSSSEVRVWVCGATAHGVQQYARETGIMGELWLENQFTNPDGNPYYWDLVLQEAVRAEPNITVFLNTEIYDVTAHGTAGHRTIDTVTGWMAGSERRITFRSPVFLDCTGDGLVGLLAGADFRTGREPQAEFGESWAPDVPDDNTLGSTILFYTKDVGHPVKFVPPSFAVDITRTAIPHRRTITPDRNGCAYWWIEWGGELDVVHDNERIRDELQGVVYGIWDYIKNSGEYDADNLTLEWIGSIPGKREYRRFIGDYTLTQHDVLEQTDFEDKVAFGGWSIDLHPPGGVYASERGSKHWHPPGNYHIPLRCLYSRNVANLWLAGRTISASHVAFGSTRVMATCAVLGEAAGTAAAVALREQLTPRELASARIGDLHRALVRADASVLGLRDDDPANLAHRATATASSTLHHLTVDEPAEPMPLTADLGMIVPAGPVLDTLELLVEASEDTELTVQAYTTARPQNYLPDELTAKVTVPVAAGEKQWVEVPLDVTVENGANVFVVIKANAHLALYRSKTCPTGVIFFTHREPAPDERWTEQFRTWKLTLPRQAVCFRVRAATTAYRPDQVIGGYARPYGGPNMWISEPLADDREPWVALTWSQPITMHELTVILDDSLDIDLINLHHHTTPYDAMPGLLRDYIVQADVGGRWTDLVRVEGNRHRRRSHRLHDPVMTKAVRVVATATNGEPSAHVVSLRVY